MDTTDVLLWLDHVSKLMATGICIGTLVAIHKGWLVYGRHAEDLKKAVEEASRRAEEWRDLYVRTLDFKDPRSLFHKAPRKLKCGEDKLGWDCRDTYDHAFCRHDCCADKDFCRAPEVDGARGYYKDIVGRDPTPPESLWARFWWTKPSTIEAAKWEWDHRQQTIKDARDRLAAKRKVHNLTIGTVLDLPSSDTDPHAWVPRQKVVEPPRAQPQSTVRWQGATRPSSPPSDDEPQRPGPGPAHR